MARIDGNPWTTGRGCKGLSGQPEVLSRRIPPGIRGRHRGEAKATPYPVPLWCWPTKKEQILRRSWLAAGVPPAIGGVVVAKPLCPGTAVPVWLSGTKEERVQETLFLPCTPGRTSLRAFRALRGLCTRHCFILHPPPPPWLVSPTSRPAPGGLGGVIKIHLLPPKDQQQPSAPSPPDLDRRSWGTLCSLIDYGCGSPSGVPSPAARNS